MNDIYLVHCFCTIENDSGNAAAVVTNFPGKDTDRLALAKKLAYPVTVFLSNLTANEPTLQFFYPDTQMPLCLHGTLAAAKILLANNNKQQLTCRTNDGKKLEICKTNEGGFQIKVSSQECTKCEIDRAEISKMLNINDINKIADDLPVCISSVGSPKLLVPLKSLKLLSELHPNYELIKKWSIDNKVNGLYVYSNETYNKSFDFHARGFNPKTGHNEDAATGVAAAALSLALKMSVRIEQGNFIKKPCSIVVTYQNPENILVGGEVSAIQRLS